MAACSCASRPWRRPPGRPGTPPVAAPSAGAARPGLPVGADAPPFELPTVDGGTRSLAALLDESKPLLLVFTDPGCGPCSALMPEVAHWQRAHAERVTVALISAGTIDASQAKARQHGVGNVLVERAGHEVASAYRYLGTPGAVVVGADGRIASEVVAGVQAIGALLRRTVAHVPAQPAPLVARPGRLAPAFELPDLDGVSRRSSDFRGNDTLLVFWNPGCGFCQRLLPEWREWEEAQGGDGPRTVVVSTGSVADNRAMGLRAPVLLDASFEVGPRFAATGTPMAVVVDSAGRVASEVAAGASAVLALASRVGGSARSADGTGAAGAAGPPRPAERAEA